MVFLANPIRFLENNPILLYFVIFASLLVVIVGVAVSFYNWLSHKQDLNDLDKIDPE